MKRQRMRQRITLGSTKIIKKIMGAYWNSVRRRNIALTCAYKKFWPLGLLFISEQSKNLLAIEKDRQKHCFDLKIKPSRQTLLKVLKISRKTALAFFNLVNTKISRRKS